MSPNPYKPTFMSSNVKNIGISSILLSVAAAMFIGVSSWFATQALVVPQLEHNVDVISTSVDKIQEHTSHAHDDIEKHIEASAEYVNEMKKDIAINTHRIEKLQDDCKDNQRFIREIIRKEIFKTNIDDDIEKRI